MAEKAEARGDPSISELPEMNDGAGIRFTLLTRQSMQKRRENLCFGTNRIEMSINPV